MAFVNAKGKITAKKKGEAVITVAAGKVKTTCKGIWKKGGVDMLPVEGLIAVLSLMLTAFGLGFAIGRDDKKNSQK